MTLAALVIVPVFLALVLGEPIAARVVDPLARRWPPSGVELTVTAPSPALVRLFHQHRAYVTSQRDVDGVIMDVVLVKRGIPWSKPLACPPCASWWLSVVATLIVLPFVPGAWVLLAPPAAYVLARLVVS